MASPRSIEVKVGILILSALGLLAAFILVMGGINFQPTYSLFVDFDNPGGMQTGAPVRIAGVKVGKITDIKFMGGGVDEKTHKRKKLVQLTVSIEKRYEKAVHENSVFYVTTQGVLGEQFLAIEPGSEDRPILAENSEVDGLDPPRLDMLLAEGYELLHSTVSSIRENKKDIGEAFDGLKRTLKGTGDFFEKNHDKLDRIASNVETITVDADDAIKGAKKKYVENPEIDHILANVDHVTDTASKDLPPILSDTKATLADVKRVASTVGDPAMQEKIKQTVTDVSEVAARAKVTTADAEAIVGHIRHGKGTVGAVVMDEELYDDLQELVRDLKHNPWKFLWRE